MEDTLEEKNIQPKYKKQIFFVAGILLLAVCGLIFLIRKDADQGTEAVPAADFFAYTDTENRLYVWREGKEEPLLLTDHAFALESGESKAPYWETWEYWDEWDEEKGDWIPNEEKALQDVVWETLDRRLLFPEDMRWTVFGMQRGAKEREEALAYATEEELEDWMKVRVFCYDLYLQASDPEQEAEKLADHVLFYSVDEKGAVWYCRAFVDGTVQVREEEVPCARCMLYRYDGKEHQIIGEIDGRRQEPYRVEKGGTLVFFYGMDDSLYGCRPGEEPKLLAEGVDSVLRRDDKSGSMRYVRDGSVYDIRAGKTETEIYAGEEDRQSVGVLGKEGDLIFVLEAAEDVHYSDWIARDEGEMDADTEELWKNLEERESGYYPLFCKVSVMDLSASPAKIVDEAEGYMLMGPVDDEEGNPKDVYYMEMMPADTFEKIPLSELLGESLPEDVLYTYTYYLDEYGADNADRSFGWALEEHWDRNVFEKRSSVYAVTKTGIHLLDGLGEGLLLGASEDYSADGAMLYLTQYQSPDMESDYRKYGHHLYYGYLENRYALDGDGNCRKMVELADETAVIGNEIFYSRNMGLEGYVNLYTTSHEEALASAADISLESVQKSGDSDTCLFLAEGLMCEEKEESIPVYAQSDLRDRYRELGIRQDRFSDEKDLHTLVLYQGGVAQELETGIYRYDFYGADSVWMLQYEEETSETEGSDGEEEENVRIGRLFVHENKEKRRLTDQAVWMIKPGSGEGGRRASWIFEQ